MVGTLRMPECLAGREGPRRSRMDRGGRDGVEGPGPGVQHGPGQGGFVPRQEASRSQPCMGHCDRQKQSERGRIPPPNSANQVLFFFF